MIVLTAACAAEETSQWSCALSQCEVEDLVVQADPEVVNTLSQLSPGSPASFHGFGFSGRERVARATVSTLRTRTECEGASAFLASLVDNWFSTDGRAQMEVAGGELVLQVEVSCWREGEPLWGAAGWVTLTGPDRAMDASDGGLLAFFPTMVGWTDPGAFLVMGSEWVVTDDSVLEAGGVPPDRLRIVHDDSPSPWTFELILWILMAVTLAIGVGLSTAEWWKRRRS